MSAAKRGMGRGLAAILAVSGDNETSDELRELPVELIRPNPSQPRRRFDQDALVALSDSLQVRGVLQPVLVRPVPGGTYELVAGERRWRAAQLAGLERIPALIRARDDAASLEVALIENMARENLNPVEESKACAALVEELGLTHADVGKRVGKSRVAISNLLRLLDLPDDVLDLIESGKLGEGHGRALLGLEDHSQRRKVARLAAGEGWTVRKLEQAVATSRMQKKQKDSQQANMIHADHRAAAKRFAAALSETLAVPVNVQPTVNGGYKLAIALSSHKAAEQFVSGLSAAKHHS